MKRFFLFLTAFTSFLGACGQHAIHEASLQSFFENSRRRVATTDETYAIANLNGCTAFFVQTTRQLQNDTYVVSARHCVDYKATDWCTRGGKIVDHQTGKVGLCSKVIAAAIDRDIVVFKVSGLTKDNGRLLKLTGYGAASGMSLKMLGYPVDSIVRAEGQPGVDVIATEDCWITADSASNLYKDTIDPSARHNCTTYGGNSGGPILHEGTRDVVGLPISYEPEDGTMHSVNDLSSAAYMARMADFTLYFQKSLSAAGIQIALQAAPVGAVSSYLRAGVYIPEDVPNCEFHLFPSYASYSQLYKLVLSFAGSSCDKIQKVEFDCRNQESGFCVNAREGSWVGEMTTKSFLYKERSYTYRAFLD